MFHCVTTVRTKQNSSIHIWFFWFSLNRLFKFQSVPREPLWPCCPVWYDENVPIAPMMRLCKSDVATLEGHHTPLLQPSGMWINGFITPWMSLCITAIGTIRTPWTLSAHARGVWWPSSEATSISHTSRVHWHHITPAICSFSGRPWSNWSGKKLIFNQPIGCHGWWEALAQLQAELRLNYPEL